MDLESKTNFGEMSIAPRKSSQNLEKVFNIAELALRILVIAFSVVGAVTMVTSKESVSFFGLTMTATYTFSPSFRFKVVADSFICGLTVLSLILVISLNRPKSNPKNYFYLLLVDLVSLVVVLSACSAAMSMGLVGLYGQSQLGWIPICNRFANFCHGIMSSIVISFLAVICLFILILMSAHKLKSQPYSESI